MGGDIALLAVLFFLVAVFYSSAGFGGGSSYLAILTFFSLDFISLRILALLCNITVVSGSVFLFYKNGFLKFKRILPLIILSIPLAYLGGRFKIEEQVFFILLGLTLFLASVLMLVSSSKTNSRQLPQYSNGVIGGGIGFLSGLVGIGGGIFLSPVLHLSQWGTPKIIAGTTALFILVNSIAGLIGQISTNGMHVDWKMCLILMLSVFVGGQIGSRVTIKKFSPVTVKRVTGILILIVSIRILVRYLS